MRRILILSLALALVGCQHLPTSPTFSPRALSTPSSMKPLCPASIVADVDPEPLPPRGFTAAALLDALVKANPTAGEAMFQWMSVDHPVWARELGGRFRRAQVECRTGENSSK